MAGLRNSFEKKCRAAIDPIYQYEPIKLSYTLECSYTPDFVDVQNKRIIESKGLFDAADRRKMLAVKRQHPDYTITIWFQNPTRKITAGSKTSYADWCDKHGIAWAKGPK